MPADFNWPVDAGAERTVTPRILKAAFGDGYAQRIPDGIRTQLGTWQLSFSNRTKAEADAINAFLANKGGHLSFSWIPPGEVQAIAVVCSTWKRSIEKGNRRSVSATFSEV